MTGEIERKVIAQMVGYVTWSYIVAGDYVVYLPFLVVSSTQIRGTNGAVVGNDAGPDEIKISTQPTGWSIEWLVRCPFGIPSVVHCFLPLWTGVGDA